MFNWSSTKRFKTYRPVCILALVAAILLLCQGTLLAGSGKSTSIEYRLKTAFLYNFTKFVEWPASGGVKATPFRVGILGEDAFGDEIKGLADKTVGGRSLAVQRYPAWDDRAKQSDILFISGSEEKNLTDILQRLDGAPVLTVGDTVAYARRGVMINFFMEDNKVRFMINLKQAQRAGFKVSSRLLKLAVILEDPVQ